MSIYRRRLAVLSSLALFAVFAALQPADADAMISGQPTDRVLRVYSNNIENLVLNNADGTCTRVSGTDHLRSILVDDAGQTGTSAVVAPDLLIVQQVRGIGQAQAYADQLSAMFGLPVGTYKALVAWDDPEPWGGSHKCSDQSLGDLKKKQTNGIIYNTGRLSLATGDISAYWSAGWLKPGTAYNGGAGCTLYKPPNSDSGTTYQYKWKRTSAIAARFTIKATGTTVFAATLHLPEENSANACAGNGDTGINGTGIHLGADASSLMNASTIRIVGIDANRRNIPSTTLSGQGMTGYGTAATHGAAKIDYLFVQGAVQPSPIDYTVSSTKSNHRALYAFIGF
ncbi:hypothetical protein D187_003278 [Cystobacter fuscus DSM 2262]|uniref:Uncharacterized protein n=1 Tax=Cystobacter fuscus (strain ATCC 25194 / DSM 2262 / NBRC 100088 / M29) TaxID=1242864 RepID=S9PPZ3_CYSF2|nr:hypothetical protein [Cystobacter fuscus]EPX64542.1 hypothetical protein D187_003278 [Cystobacter fuscus DSM 2262]